MTHEILHRRRDFLTASLAAGAGLLGRHWTRADEPKPTGGKSNRAQIAITLDLEMSRNFPAWDDTHWDYEKGNLNDETKRYTLEACRRVKSHGGVLHCFSVARVCEQENVDWLKEIAAAGHPIGNHTYDHVNVRAAKNDDVQFRFKRSPWLVEGRPPAEVIRENIRLASMALQERASIKVAGFRTPGGFATALVDRPDLQQMLLDLGFTWVSSLYPAHPTTQGGQRPSEDVLSGIVAAQAVAQPFSYPSGLIEVPMSPISDIGAFRGGRWQLDWFLEAIGRGVNWAIEHGAAYDFLGHPSCLYVADPKFETVERICDLVSKAGDRAEIVNLDTLAKRGIGRPRRSFLSSLLAIETAKN